MVTKRVLKKCFQDAQDLNYGSYPGILTPRTKRSIEICDVSKLNLHRSLKINRSIQIQFSNFRCSVDSFHSSEESRGLFNHAQSLFSCFPSSPSRARIYMRVTDLCKLEQKRLLSGYLSTLTRSPQRRPSRDEILPTLSVASLFVER